MLAGNIGESQVFLSLIPDASINDDRSAVLEKTTSTLNELKETILSAEEVKKESVFDIGFNTAVMGELDKLFSSEAEDETGDIPPELSEPQKQAAMAAFSLSYDEALAVGLILPTKNSDNE